MRVRIAAVLLLLVLQLRGSYATRINDDRNQNLEIRARRHDSQERTPGRRWTTSVNSPYKKIVSSYEQEVPDEESSSEPVETSSPEVPDQAKAKSHKRKQWRASASSHDQIPSETSSSEESHKAESESNNPDTTDTEVQKNQTSHGLPSRRRSAPIHTRETSTEISTESSTPNPKKRRRPATTAATTTTLAPQTMSDTLYQYFRPLDQDVPQDDIIPFLDFGRKLSPVIPTPSGANSIENKSSFTKLRPRNHHDEKESNSSDEEILQEDMDVTVVKKAIERNSVPRAKLKVREQGISDFYRKRVPTQIRTTENLVGTSDSSTAPSVPGTKHIGMLKKHNRHQVHHLQPLKGHDQMIQETKAHKVTVDLEKEKDVKNVEILPEKRRQMISRGGQRSAALKQETQPSPLTAESSLVKTVIKELPVVEQNKEKESNKSTTITTTTPKLDSKDNNSTITNVSTSSTERKILLPEETQPVNSNRDKQSSKVLSTAVVTSVSVQESKDAQQLPSTETPKEAPTTKRSVPTPLSSEPLPLSVVESKNTSSTWHPIRAYTPNRNSSNSFPSNSSNINATNSDVKSTPIKNETPLRSREIYRPKIVNSGISIPHLPRQLPIAPSPRTSSTPEMTTSTLPPESTTKLDVSNPSVHSSTTITAKTPIPPDTTPSPLSSSTGTRQTHATTKHPLPQEVITSEISNFTESTIREGLDRIIPREEDGTTNMTLIIATDGEEFSENGGLQHSVHNDDEYTPLQGSDSAEETLAQDVETESVPPPKYDDTVENLTFVPVYSYTPEEQFPIYFTTLPTATVPVVDTRPETETAVVEEQKNVSTSRSGAEWVKVGAVNKDVEVVYPETIGVGAYILAALGVVPILLGALIGARFILAHNRKKVLDESEYSSEYNRSPLAVSPASPLPTKLPRIPTHVTWGESEKNVPTISPVTSSTSARWEFPREKLRLQTLLGQGNFGQVWKAEADDIAGHEGLTRLVAVKTVKEEANAREREDLLRELGIMQELGSHPNVVTLLGCCTEKEPIYLLMEYVMYGKLLSFLRDHRTRAHYYNFSDATDALTSRDLTVFAYCVARGMDYLTNKSIIHRDLAARNVLVDHNKLCKIADFGMSRNVRDTGQIYEQRQSKGALPIRWMAPESLHFSLFTHKTDVWSFGILMWEIVTLGSTPYATMGAREVMRRVRNGYRLDRPSHCRPELFRVIAKCWHSEPSKRPTFAELKVELGQLLSDSELKGSLVDLDSFADEMRRDTIHRHH